ncbi:hypothetical protein ACU635_50480 [[Actinomadura] parvosata]|uniref:hypothetical protein n=1 Tax=[Actinomadura] parvosata TaxID=1955412 RepID=UPI00406CA9E9
MDSHGSVPPIAAPAPAPGTGAPTSRPADGDVTRRRPAVEIPEFLDVKQQPDGTWTAVHESGRRVTAQSFRHLVFVAAPAVRISRSWRCAR